MDLRHHVVLKYSTVEQLNRHAARLIDKEGFMSGGAQPGGTYLFVKYNIEPQTYEALIRFGREEVAFGDVRIAVETRTAW
jgi:hypothetical protein